MQAYYGENARPRAARCLTGWRAWSSALLILTLSGCAAGVTALSAAGSALQAAGLAKPDVPDAQKPPRQLSLGLDAGVNLNAGAGRTPLALVVRVYTLRDASSFQQTGFDTFLDSETEKKVLGADLLQVRELTLIPGQRYSAIEKVPREAGALGIVALFRQPAAQRWRIAFDPEKSEKTGILIGLHACALTATAGTVIAPARGAPIQSLNMLSNINCR